MASGVFDDVASGVRDVVDARNELHGTYLELACPGPVSSTAKGESSCAAYLEGR